MFVLIAWFFMTLKLTVFVELLLRNKVLQLLYCINFSDNKFNKSYAIFDFDYGIYQIYVCFVIRKAGLVQI